MAALISQIAVIAIIVIVLIVILALFGVIKFDKGNVSVKKEDIFKKNKLVQTEVANKKDLFGTDAKTAIMAFWVLEQLNDAGKVVKSFEITEITERGLIVGVGSDCDFQLEPCRYVGHRHAVIGRDEKGMFIQDLESKNGMYDMEQNRVKELDIKDNLCVYLGNTKIRFRAINPFNKVEKEVKNNEKQNDFVTRVRRL